MAKGRMMNKRIAKSDKLAALAKDRDRVVYFMLYPHLDRDGRYSADPRDIKEDCIPRLRYSPDQIAESLRALHDVGLIAIYEVDGKQYLEASRFDDFQVGLHKDREAPSEIPPNPGLTPENSGKPRTPTAKVPLNHNIKVKVKVKENVELRSAIISHLNEKTGKHFLTDSAGTVKLINSRLSEGRTLENFKHVIDIKVGQWLGDPKMDAYLRPDTLFAQSNFESYLNERIILTRAQAEKHVGASKTPRSPEADAEIKAVYERMSREYEPKIEAAEKSGDRKEVTRLRDEAQAQLDGEASAILAKYANKTGEARP